MPMSMPIPIPRCRCRNIQMIFVTCTAIVKMHTQLSYPSFRCSKSTIKKLEQGKKHVQSQQ